MSDQTPATFMHRDVEISCTSNGYFIATIVGDAEPVEICESTLAKAREAIDRVLSRERNRRSRPSVPVYMYYETTLEMLEWRGFQHGSALMLVTTAEGEKKRLKLRHWRDGAGVWLIPVSLVDARLREAHARVVDLTAELRKAKDELTTLVAAAGVPLPTYWDLRGHAEEHELAVRGKLDELERKSKIRRVL